MGKNKHPKFVEIEVSGNGFERGVAHGEALIDYVSAYCGPSLRERAEKTPNGKKLIEQSLAYLERNMPEIIQEMRGIAHGAKQNFTDIVYWNFNRALGVHRASACTNLAMGCTKVGPAVAATVDGDAPTQFGWGKIPQDPEDPYPMFIQKSRPEHGHRIIASVLPGTIWVELAMNEYGLVITQSGIDTTDMQPYGLPFHTFYREGLANCRNTEEALAYFDRNSQVFFGGDFAIIDESGNVRRVEKSPTLQAVIPQKTNWAGTANGFSTMELQGVQNQIPVLVAEAPLRRERQRMFVDKVGDSATPDDMIGFIRSHESPTQICKHCEDGVYHSGESYLLLCKERMMLVGSRGYPCQVEMKEFFL